MSSRISRTQHVLSTDSLFEEADINDCLLQGLKSRRQTLLCVLLDCLPPACGQSSVKPGWIARSKSKSKSKTDEWKFVPKTLPYTNEVARVHAKPRNKRFNPIDSDCPVNLQGLARQGYIIMKTKTGDVEFDLTWVWTTPDSDIMYDWEDGLPYSWTKRS